jgi:hypothetical protein
VQPPRHNHQVGESVMRILVFLLCSYAHQGSALKRLEHEARTHLRIAQRIVAIYGAGAAMSIA